MEKQKGIIINATSKPERRHREKEMVNTLLD